MSRKPPVWRVEPLDASRHDRSGFSCGQADLDRYLRSFATQDIKRDVARVFVAFTADEPARIAGFYSLSAASFVRDNLPAAQARKLPHYPIPAVALGRLAVAKDQQGQGLGTFLLMDALYRVALASQTLAIHAIVVDAKDETVAAYYAKFGFAAFAGYPLKLFLPVATVRQLLEG